MTDATPRLQLPFLSLGQAQKEVTHNEALSRLDICVQAVVEDEQSVPPEAPEIGQCWLVGANAQGAWIGNEDTIAQWTEGGWRFVTPFDGFSIWVRASGLRWNRESGVWSTSLEGSALRIEGKQVVGAQQGAISLPIGGNVQDAEARATIALIIASLAAHGLIAN